VRVLHLVSEYSAHEAIGRTIAEAVERVDGEHHLFTARLHDGAERFASATVSDGSMTRFPTGEPDALHAAVAAARPDLVHLHGGALLPFLSGAKTLAPLTKVATIYAWPRVPKLQDLRRATLRELRVSNVLRGRVLATSVLGRGPLVGALRHVGTKAVLTPDPEVVRRLGTVTDLPVIPLPSGASPDSRRAVHSTTGPVVLFAGRAETVRGIDVLLDAAPAVLAAVPDARFRLLLLPTPELATVLARIDARGLADRVEVSTEPVPDLHAELARAQVGVWPFLFDYTTSPPAMALAEAMAVGLPVVSTPVACVRSIATDGVNALLAPPGDAAATAAAIVRILRDADTWTALAEGGLQTISDTHSWDHAARTTATAYRTALEAA